MSFTRKRKIEGILLLESVLPESAAPIFWQRLGGLMIVRARFIALLAFPLAACSPPAATSAPLQSEVEDLIRQTIDNLVFVERGSFMMGDVGTYITRESYSDLGNFEYVDADHPDAMYGHWTAGPHNEDNKPAHEVTLSSYSLAKHETTYGEYDVFTEATGRDLIRPELAEHGIRSPAHPVPVNWHEARDYCLWLGKQTGLPFDLPTEAQWEFAARSRGQNVLLATDDGWLDEGRNYLESRRNSKPVSSFPPNPLGLHDMSGNLEEWVRDRYSATYYEAGTKIDPEGPAEGETRVIRGGYYGSSPSAANVFVRANEAPDVKPGLVIGFRCAVSHPQPIVAEELSVMKEGNGD